MRIGDNDYSLVLLDTNLFSRFSMEPRTYLQALNRLVGDRLALLCFSPYSLFELRRAPAIYAAFLDVFDVYPCAILKNEEMIFEDERGSYYSGESIDPLLFGFSFLNTQHGTNLRNLIEVVFAHPDTAQRELKWPVLKSELLSDWLCLKANFPPKGRTYLLPQAREFGRVATLQHVAARAPQWVAELRGRGEKVDGRKFPSVTMTLLTVFFRIYEPVNRKPVPQDVFDVLISTPAPYLDIVITEKMQAEIYRKARKIFPAISHLEVFTLRDLAGV
jgi:hypothetical protein